MRDKRAYDPAEDNKRITSCLQNARIPLQIPLEYGPYLQRPGVLAARRSEVHLRTCALNSVSYRLKPALTDKTDFDTAPLEFDNLLAPEHVTVAPKPFTLSKVLAVSG